MKKTKIDVYLWKGKKWFFEIKSECDECNLVMGLLRDMEKKELKNKVEINTYPWLDNFFTLLFKGGWHAPIVLVNGKVFSQEIVPNRKKLADAVIQQQL